MLTGSLLHLDQSDVISRVKHRDGRGRAHVRNRHKRVSGYRCGYCNVHVLHKSPSMMTRRALIRVRIPVYTTVTITLTGSGTFVVPATVTSLQVDGLGAGAGGGAGTNLGLGGGPGTSGAGAQWIGSVSPGDSFAYSVGTGGGPGLDGADTSFGSILLAKGGIHGGNNTNSVPTPPNASACLGTTKVSGNSGSANTGGNGGTGGSAPSIPGWALTSGAGGLSGAAYNASGQAPLNGMGGPGQPYGAGGGGSRNLGTRTGGAGSDGALAVTYTYSS